ncbi:MAG: ATP-binding protein [Acidobacteriia bacterium]|jgi:serine/threonine-protein kinase RsbW|nr:ATP-binding protein [Terriglobia bacterium]
MVALTRRIEVTLETQLDSVDLGEQIALRVAGAAGFDEEEQHKIGMAVREGIINAYQYGNRQQRGKKIFLNFELAADRLIVEVLDQGTGFDLHQVPDPLAEENLLKTSGRGIFLIRCFMDELDVQRGPQGGARLIMTKRYPPHLRSNLSPGPHRETPRRSD